MNTQVANPFGQQQPRQEQGLVAVEQQRAIQEVQAAMVIAKKFPRNPVEAMDRILQSCSRPSLAEGALYSYNRGGADVTGPSIRLAEALAQAWGNMQFGIRELEQRKGESVVEAFAWDVESNTKQVKIFTVPHIRHTRNGQKRLEDPRDIYELVANNGARRLRACILGVIPGDVIESAQRQCEVTLTTHADTSPESIKKMVDTFASEFGVTTEQIQAYLGRRVDAMLPAQYVQMRKVYASLRDGMSKPSDWFKVQDEADQPTASKALDAMRGQPITQEHPRANAEQRQALMPEEHIDQAPPSEVQVTPDAQNIGDMFAQFAEALESAETLEQLAEIWKSAAKWGKSTGNEKLLSDLTTIKDERKAQLSAA